MHFVTTLLSAWLVVSVGVAILFGRFVACGRGEAAEGWGLMQRRPTDGN
jgi:hypothetical protein